MEPESSLLYSQEPTTKPLF